MEDTTTSAGRKPRAPWTPQDEATLRDLTGEGRTDAQIAAHMARDVKLIGKKRRALNIDRGVPAGRESVPQNRAKPAAETATAASPVIHAKAIAASSFSSESSSAQTSSANSSSRLRARSAQ